MLYMVTFTINIPPMLAYIPYMDDMGYTCHLPPVRKFCHLKIFASRKTPPAVVSKKAKCLSPPERIA